MGLLGGVLGGWIFRTLIGPGFGGFIGSLLTATIGAVIILFVLRAVRGDRG